ncbi:hypothetical protein evm_011544 [Chilo suppressalis]|nr:hypothetical protein evm_011544 [Chilo suppressalis]
MDGLPSICVSIERVVRDYTRVKCRIIRKKKLVLAYYLYKKKQKEIEKRKRSSWVHPILLEREKYGAFQTLFTQLEEDETKFYNYFRMKKEIFQLLLTAIYDKIRHEDTDMRKSISPAERLAVTIRYLAAGNTFSDLHYSFRMGIKTISCIVQEVFEALWETLSPIYMKLPSEDEWLTIAKNFETNANFPHCLGAIDGKHIRIIKPEESGSMFFNYKHYFSIVLMAVVDTNYNFVFIDVGAYGKECDSAVIIIIFFIV